MSINKKDSEILEKNLYVLEPSEFGITIYTDKGCSSCKKLLNFMNENQILHSHVDCSNFFPHNIMPLALFVDKYIRSIEDYCEKYKNKIIFPMIFCDRKFSGYCETIEEYKNIILKYK